MISFTRIGAYTATFSGVIECCVSAYFLTKQSAFLVLYETALLLLRVRPYHCPVFVMSSCSCLLLRIVGLVPSLALSSDSLLRLVAKTTPHVQQESLVLRITFKVTLSP